MAQMSRADTSHAVQIQRKYYAESAQSYDEMHGDEHGSIELSHRSPGTAKKFNPYWTSGAARARP